jgi:hypothetical protein
MIVFIPQTNNKFMLFVCKENAKPYEPLIPDERDINFKVEPLLSTNLSKGEKEFNNIIKHFVGILDLNHDPFIFNLLTTQRLFIKFNKKSSSLLFRDSFSKKDLSIKSVQARRKLVDKKYPHKITLRLDYKDRYLIASHIRTKNYLINRLCSLTGSPSYGSAIYDICFKTEKSLNRFIKSYISGKIVVYHSETRLKNSTKTKLYGKHLKKLLSKWKNMYVMTDFDCYNIINNFGSLFSNNDREYENKLKEIHKWAKNNLDKRFLMMGTFPEIWFFEDEDDMNFFRIRWS